MYFWPNIGDGCNHDLQQLMRFNCLVLLFLIFVNLILLSGCQEKNSADCENKVPLTLNFPKEIQEIYLYCEQSELDSIYASWNQMIYIPVKVKFHNKEWKTVKMRLRGDSSKEYPKKSLKLLFPKDELFANGSQKLNLNAEYKDRSYCKQWLSSELMTLSGQVCYKTEHIKVFVNDKFYGLYLQVENIDEDFISRHQLDPKSNLYKATKDGASLSKFDDLNYHWEKKTNKKGSWNDLEKLIGQINTVPQEEFHHFLKETFEYDKLINLMALNMYLGNGSTYYHNYYMYHDLYETGKWQMFPWDMDKSISYYGWMPYQYQRTSSDWESDNMLIEKAVANDSVMLDIKNRLLELSQTSFNMDLINPVLDQMSETLKEAVLLDESDNIPSEEDWRKRIFDDREFLKNQYDNISTQINTYPRTFFGHPIEGIVEGDVKIEWDESFSPVNKPLTYNFRVSKDFLFEDSSTKTVEGIKDRFIQLTGLEEGKYFWQVEATDGEFVTLAYNSKRAFEVKKYNRLPKSINSPVVLTQKESPYLIEDVLKVNSKLTIEPGVQIYFNESARMEINRGQIVANGKKSAPIDFFPAPGVHSWDQVYLIGCANECLFDHVRLKEGVLNSTHSNLRVTNCTFSVDKKDMIQGGKRPSMVWVEGGKFFYDQNKMLSNGQGEGMNVHEAEAVVSRSYFDNAPDAIEYINVSKGIIKNNYVVNSSDDAIDLNGCKDVVIEFNVLFNNADKGISIGTEQYGSCHGVLIRNNLMVKNGIGICVKDDSDAYGSNNTMVNNKLGVKVYLKSEKEKMGGRFKLENSIIKTNGEKLVFVDASSSLIVNNTLYDNGELEGDGNRKGDVAFRNPLQMDYFLNDNKSSQGAFLDSMPFVEILGISLIDSVKNRRSIKLMNNMPIDIDLSLWKVKVGESLFTVPIGTRITANETLTISESKKRSGPNKASKLYVEEFLFDGLPVNADLIDSNNNIICRLK